MEDKQMGTRGDSLISSGTIDMEDKQSKCHADEIPRGERGSGLESFPPVYTDAAQDDLQGITIPEHYSHDDIWYKMDNLDAGKKCGICAIIKVKSPDTQEQSGAEADAKTIESVFGGVIGFDVKVYHASTPADIREKLKTCKDDIEKDSSRASDCFACFVLGHGKEDITFPFGGELIDLEYIYEQFSNKVCTKLLGKPKLFFLHTLRGGKQGGKSDFADGPSKTTSVPSHADFFIFESTSTGYLTSPRAAGGSLFVQALCQVIKRDYLTKNFQEMMTMVQYYVAREKKPDETLYGYSTLRKNIRFAPPAEVGQPSLQSGQRLFDTDDNDLEYASETTIIWRPKNINRLIKVCTQGGALTLDSSRFQLNRYAFIFSLQVMKIEDEYHLIVVLYLCKGPDDDELKWPFSTRHTITLHHPTDESMNIPKVVQPLADQSARFERPRDGIKGTQQNLFKVEKIHDAGYVVDDALQISLTLHTRT